MSFDLIKKGVKFIFCAVLLSSCVGELNIPYPVYEEQFVLNGILNPDSLISITLRKTQPPLSTNTVLPVVQNAIVHCYENGQLLGKLEHTDNGNYVLPMKYPKQGNTYTIQAEVGTITLSATDTVPDFIPFEIEVVPYQIKNPNGNPDLHLTWTDPMAGEHFVWLGYIGLERYQRLSDGTYSLRETFGGVLSASPFLDDFNSSSSPGDLINAYSYLARILPAFVGKQTIVFSFHTQASAFKVPGGRLDLSVNQVSRAYDRYIKTAITAANNRLVKDDGGLNNPFYEPINVYSNVKNGLGFFGAVNSRRQVIFEGNEK